MLYTMKDLFGANITGGKYDPVFYATNIAGISNDDMFYQNYYNPDAAPHYYDGGNYTPCLIDWDELSVENDFDLIA